MPPISIAMYAPRKDPKATVVRADCQSHHSQKCVCSWPWPLLLALTSTTARVFATDLCHYTGTCSWPLQPSVCTPLAPTTTIVYPGPYLLDLEVSPKGPNSPCSLCGPPAVLAKNYTVVDAMDSISLSQ